MSGKAKGQVKATVIKAADPVISAPIKKSDAPSQVTVEEAVNAGDWIEPPMMLEGLKNMVTESSILPQCIRAYKNNIAGFGIGIRYTVDQEETPEMKAEFDAITEVVELLNVDQDTKQVFENIVEARETYGIAYLEVIRNLDKEVQQIEFIKDTPSVRKSRPMEPYVEIPYFHHGKETKRRKKFRKYKQEICGRTVYFKEFGDPRIMDLRDGRYVPEGAGLVQAIQDGTVSVPEELKTAIDRATTDIDPDPVTIEGMQAEVDDVEVNQDHVDQLIQDALGDLGTVEGEVDGDIQIKVEKGNCLSQIGEALGVDWHEIAEYNGIEDPYTIYPDMELKIPKEKVNTDASGVGEAAEEAAKSETGETIETEQGVKTTLTDEGVDGSQTAQAAEEEAKSQTAETVEREQPVKTNMTNAGVDDSQVTQAAQEQETQAEPKETDVPTTIKFEVASLDDSELASAISEKLQQGEAVPVEVPANVTIKAGAIDDTQLSSEITGKLGEQSAVPVNVPANITLTAGNVDSSQAVATTQSDVISAFSAALPADGTVDVTLAKGNDNIASVYDYVGGLVRSAWANPYSASGTVHVTLTANYSLANPTKTISFGGGATGSATVTAALHATGGIFDEPHLGMVAEAGPEAIIPLDGSGNAMELWQEAGKRLGALEDGPIQIAPSMYSGGKNTDGNGQEAKASSNRTIDININGNGSITAGKGVSKDDIVQVLMEKVRDVFVNIVTEEALVGGDASYEF